jgi:hypothetical protein
MKPTTNEVVVQGVRGTLTAGEFGVTFTAIDTSKPEQTEVQREAERKADKISYSELLKTYGWSDGDFEYAKSLPQFPAPLGWRAQRWGGGRESFYSRSAIAACLDRVRAFTTKLPVAR